MKPHAHEPARSAAGFSVDEEWEAAVTLADGRKVYFRLLAARDRELLQMGFDQLSQESRYQRFMTSIDELPQHYLDHLTSVDNQNHLAVIALTRDELGRELNGLGVARYFRDEEDPTSAELAVTIADDAQGLGLGSMLVAICGVAALQRDITHFHAELMPENDGMKRLVSCFGGHLRPSDSGLESWVIPLESEE